MNNSAKSLSTDQSQGQISQEEWDNIFIAILKDFYDESKLCAHQNVMQVIGLSKNFLVKDTHKSLEKFHDLYFNPDNNSEKTEAYNNDISDFVENMQKKMNEGKDLDEELKGNPEHALNLNEQDRLQLALIQKQMESLITLDKSLKEKLSPILASMQFEDTMRQRLEHLDLGLDLIDKLSSNPNDKEINEVINAVETSCTSHEETTEFYEEVKKQEPPKGFKQEKGLVFKF